MSPFEENPLKHWLYMLVKQAKSDLEKRFVQAKVGITPFQYGILLTLKTRSLTLNELARIMHIRPPSLVSPVDDLEAAGFLKRQPDKTDRRKINLLITEKSLKLLKRVPGDDPHDSLNTAAQGLSPGKRHQLISLLQELASNLPTK